MQLRYYSSLQHGTRFIKDAAKFDADSECGRNGAGPATHQWRIRKERGATMSNRDFAHAIAALSARVSALEGAMHAMAQGGKFDQTKTLAVFDAYGRELVERYSGLPIDDGVIDPVEQSLRDVRELLAGRVS
jgi:hypothetical protein